MNHFFNRYRGIIIPILIVIFSLAGFIFGVLPAANQIFSKIGQLRDTVSQTTAIGHRIETIAQFPEELLTQYGSLVAGTLPQDKSLASVFSSVDSLATQTGVSILDIGVTNAGTLATESGTLRLDFEKKTGVRIVPVSLSLLGSNEAITTFISKAASARRMMIVQNFELSRTKDGLVNFHGEIDFLFKPYESTLAKSAAGIVGLTDAEVALLNDLARIPVSAQTSSTSPGPVIPKGRDNPFVR